jgi:hypothetical protein
MLGCKSLELWRNLSLLRFVFQLMPPALLERIGLNVAINFLCGRQHAYLAVPATEWPQFQEPFGIYINGIIYGDGRFGAGHIGAGCFGAGGKLFVIKPQFQKFYEHLQFKGSKLKISTLFSSEIITSAMVLSSKSSRGIRPQGEVRQNLLLQLIGGHHVHKETFLYCSRESTPI